MQSKVTSHLQHKVLTCNAPSQRGTFINKWFSLNVTSSHRGTLILPHTRQRQTRWFTSGLSLTRVLSWISAKPIVYRLFSILNSDLIHNNLCFYNVWIYSRSHSATRIIRAACYRKFYFDFPSPLLAYSPLAKPARVPLTQLNPYFTHAYTHLTLFHCYLLKWQIRVYLCVQVRTRSSCIRRSWSWRLWRHGSASCLGNRPSWGNG